MKVTFITTVHHNVGDDFVRDGITHLLRRVLGPFEQLLIHKHFPLTVRPEWAWLHDRGITKMMDHVPGMRALRWSQLIDQLPLRPATDKILTTDLLVQSGAPVYWLNQGSDCSRNEWYAPLVQRRWERVRSRVPLLNLGAGTCQAYHSDGSEFLGATATLNFIRKFHAQCALTTVRDELSRKILSHAGVAALVLPCPSLFARRLHGIEAGQGEYVALNYMRLGGHYQLGGAIDAAAWREAFVKLAQRLAQSHRCLLVCHDREEEAEAAALLPEMPRFFSDDHRDYLRVYALAKAGVVNRVHAAFALASFGLPSLVVGNDSRARMTEIIGLPCIGMEEATVERIWTELNRLLAAAPGHRARLANLIAETETAYVHLLGPLLNVGGSAR